MGGQRLSVASRKQLNRDPYRFAMSMLTFYMNRAGKHPSRTQRSRLELAKDELRDLYGKERGRYRHPSARKREK